MLRLAEQTQMLRLSQEMTKKLQERPLPTPEVPQLNLLPLLQNMNLPSTSVLPGLDLPPLDFSLNPTLVQMFLNQMSIYQLQASLQQQQQQKSVIEMNPAHEPIRRRRLASESTALKKQESMDDDQETLIASSDKEGWCRNKKYIKKTEDGFMCTVCKKKYGRYNSVSYHVTIYHRNPPIRCDMGDCQFATREARYIHFHKYYRHGVPLPESIDQGSRRCPHCKHVSKSPAMLDKHIKKHLQERSTSNGSASSLFLGVEGGRPRAVSELTPPLTLDPVIDVCDEREEEEEREQTQQEQPANMARHLLAAPEFFETKSRAFTM
ncbi:unnamed protein product, partial [Mesorhabditis spiculigera]